MANPMDVLKKAGVKHAETKKEEADEAAINEMVERIFTTRNLAHFAHWNTTSYASHMALNELYDGIVGAADDVVEGYQGEFGLLTDIETCSAKLDKDIVEYVLEDSVWIKENRDKISKGSDAISSLVDALSASYNKCLYKLKNLK